MPRVSRFGEGALLSQREKPEISARTRAAIPARGRRGGKRDAQTARCGEPQHRGERELKARILEHPGIHELE